MAFVLDEYGVEYEVTSTVFDENGTIYVIDCTVLDENGVSYIWCTKCTVVDEFGIGYKVPLIALDEDGVEFAIDRTVLDEDGVLYNWCTPYIAEYIPLGSAYIPRILIELIAEERLREFHTKGDPNRTLIVTERQRSYIL